MSGGLISQALRAHRDQSGFLDAQAARRALRRLRLRCALREGQALTAALLDGLDQSGQAARDRVSALVEGGVELAHRDVERGIGGDGIDRVESQDMREQQLLEGAHLCLQLLHALLDGLGHGLFSSASSFTSNANPGAPVAHRLNEGLK